MESGCSVVSNFRTSEMGTSRMDGEDHYLGNGNKVWLETEPTGRAFAGGWSLGVDSRVHWICLSLSFLFFLVFFFGLLLFVVVIVLIFGLWVWDDVYWVGDGTLWGFCARVTELTDLCLLRSCICLSRLISVPV